MKTATELRRERNTYILVTGLLALMLVGIPGVALLISQHGPTSRAAMTAMSVGAAISVCLFVALMLVHRVTVKKDHEVARQQVSVNRFLELLRNIRSHINNRNCW
jgi:cyanate permease